MEQLINSRLITWPSTVEKSTNHTVVLVDASAEEIEDIANFFRTSHINFDVYLYESNQGDLEYLGHVSSNSECVLINNNSNIHVKNIDYVRYGTDCELESLLTYFKKIEQNEVDSFKI